MRAMGRWPARCRCAMAMDGDVVADVQAVGGGVKAGVEGDHALVKGLVKLVLKR